MSIETGSPSTSGILDSLRAFGDGFLASAQDRFELLSVDLQVEKYRLVQLFIWTCALILCAGLALIFASLALVVYFWESARLAAFCGLALGYVVLFFGLMVAFRRYQARQPKPFAATLAELQEDRTCIQRKN